MTDNVSSFDLYLRQQLEDPIRRAAYEDYEARRALVDELVARRKDLGVTQREVANQMGVKQPMVSGFENENTDPRLSTIYRYARAVKACISFVLHTQDTDGSWRRRAYRAWRPATTYRPFAVTASYQSEQECEVIPLRPRWEQVPLRSLAHG